MIQVLHSDRKQANYLLVPWHANYGCGDNVRHIHPVYHFIFILAGRGQMERDGYSLALEKGDLLIVNPNELHVFHAELETGFSYYSLNFYLLAGEQAACLGGTRIWQGLVDLNQLAALAETEPLEQLFDLAFFQHQRKVRLPDFYWSRLEQLLLLYDRRFAAVNPGFKRFWLDPQTADKAAFALLSHVLLTELLELFSQAGRPDDRAANEDPLLTGLTGYFNSLVRQKYRQDALYEQFKYNPVYLSAYFRKKTGMTPRAYINSQKIRQACLLLQSTSLRIEDIAADLHYHSPSHFCVSFKNRMHMTPKAYRELSLQ